MFDKERRKFIDSVWLAAHQLKRFDEAMKELARSQQLLNEERWKLDVDLRVFLWVEMIRQSRA